MKKYSLVLILCFIAKLVSANTVTTSNGNASLNSSISMNIATDNCIISNSASLRGLVEFDDVSIEDLKQHATYTESIPLEINCTPGATTALISVTPAPGYQLVTDGADGRITTDLAGVGLAVYWQATVAEVNMSAGYSQRFNYHGRPINASLLVKTVTTGTNIKPGIFHSAIVIAVTYI